MADQSAEFDVVIVGGGINGAGIARDAALRGLRTLLLEAKDFGGGTSSWSSRLIHGGLRYLEYGEIPLVYESLHERAALRKIAPHLVRPLRLVIPLYRDGHRARWLVRLGMLAYDLLSLGKSLPNHRMLSAAQVAEQATAINRDGLLGGASYYDAQVSYAERLVIENVLSAVAAGAQVRNYSPVTGLQLSGTGAHSVQFTDSATGTAGEVTTNCIVNAAGPWVDKVLQQTGARMPRLVGGTKGSHIVIDTFAGGPQDALYVEATSDGRPMFIIPWNGQYLIGTTDLRFDGDPREARASIEEVDYLLETVTELFPSVRVGRKSVHYAYAGVRPLPYVTKGPEGAITRAHIIHRHKAPGVYSIVGGKLTTYRNLAEQAVDKLQKFLGRKLRPCVTAEEPLPGGEPASVTSIDGLALSDVGGRRLQNLYGSRVARLAELCAQMPQLARTIDARNEILAAEVVLAVRDEFACNLVDLLHRRLMAGLNADQGRAVAHAVAEIAARECAWDETRLEAEIAALDRYNRRLREPETYD